VPQILAVQPYAALATAKSVLAREDEALQRFMARSQRIPSAAAAVGQTAGTDGLGEGPHASDGKLKAESGIQQKTLLLRLPPHTHTPPGENLNGVPQQIGKSVYPTSYGI
jgi:hypothetical protein